MWTALQASGQFPIRSSRAAALVCKFRDIQCVKHMLTYTAFTCGTSIFFAPRGNEVSRGSKSN